MRALLLYLATMCCLSVVRAASAPSPDYFDVKSALRFRVETNSAWNWRILSVYLRVDNLDKIDCPWALDLTSDLQARVSSRGGNDVNRVLTIRTQQPGRDGQPARYRIPAGSSLELRISAAPEDVNSCHFEGVEGKTLLMIGTSVWLLPSDSLSDCFLGLHISSRPWCLSGRVPKSWAPFSFEIPQTRISLR